MTTKVKKMLMRFQKKTISNAVREYCSSKRVYHKNDLAVKSGVSGATINKVLNGKWK
jgi:hypothetical protein